jgi:fibronectin type 3 domain-containing protein
VNGANVTGVNFTATAQTNPTYSISGTITPTAGGSGAAVTLSGAATASTTADSSGNYSFSSLANGTYTVTPSNTGYTFTPTNQSVTVNGANISGVNFTATAQQTHSAALSWTASTSTVSGYNVYRGTVNGGPYTLLNTSLITVLSYTDTAVQSGATYYYVTTAVDSNGVESVYSNQVTAAIP